MAPPELLKEIANKEADLSLSYANFRAKFDGKLVTENDLVEKLRTEKNPAIRKKVWESTKEVGDILAPKILDLVRLRNQLAKSLGFSDYFAMQMKLQEVDSEKLFAFFEELSTKSAHAYAKLLDRMEKEMSETYQVTKEDLGPWAWKDPFGQEDPLAVNLDTLIKGTDVVQVAREFYKKMNQPVEKILEKSDLYEREKKSQHAFCIDMDRRGDVRTLDNIRPTLRWMDTILHELGHGIYELGFDSALPWLLRTPPHMITTEAMALFSGRQAYNPEFYKEFFPADKEKQVLSVKALESQKRRQLIFSRWVFVMTFFEKELYKNPEQDLNGLWWRLVEKYQGIRPPIGRESHQDWAAKYHIAMAPVYYYSYLLGEVFASSLKETILEKEKCNLWSPKAGDFLQKNLFFPGNRYRWDVLIEKVLGAPLRSDAWIKEYAQD
jgi:peptidyl-dipeptidase A